MILQFYSITRGFTIENNSNLKCVNNFFDDERDRNYLRIFLQISIAFDAEFTSIITKVSFEFFSIISHVSKFNFRYSSIFPNISDSKYTESVFVVKYSLIVPSFSINLSKPNFFAIHFNRIEEINSVTEIGIDPNRSSKFF